MNNKFKSYKECIPYLFNLERAGIKYDLNNIKLLLSFLDNPQTQFKSIHIAGTNGKGSVSSLLNSYLMEKGFKTGLYTSPHLRDFRERISVSGRLISRHFILEFMNKIYNEIEKIKPSFFEVTTAMAFEYFKKRKVEYAVIETGLGGRLDSTNVLKPVLSVITSLSIDHVEFLGNSIEKITYEKGGIIKKNIPVVIGNVSDVSKQILKKTAKKNNSEIIFSSGKNKIKIIRRSENGLYFDLNSKSSNLYFPMIGDYQVSNLKTFLSAADALKKYENLDYNEEVLRRSLKNIKRNSNISGRFELISENPKIILDVSHNLQAIQNIKKNLIYFKFEKLIIIFAMMKDKNYEECLSELSKLRAKIILTKPEYKRSAEPSELLKAVKRNRSGFIVKNDLKSAVKEAREISGRKDLILITGSFFLAGDYLNLPDRLK